MNNIELAKSIQMRKDAIRQFAVILIKNTSWDELEDAWYSFDDVTDVNIYITEEELIAISYDVVDGQTLTDIWEDVLRIKL